MFGARCVPAAHKEHGVALTVHFSVHDVTYSLSQ
jgi:hypothetical protein